MKRINVKASALGVSVPADYAKDAKCTKKRREKQDAYCKAKVRRFEGTMVLIILLCISYEHCKDTLKFHVSTIHLMHFHCQIIC